MLSIVIISLITSKTIVSPIKKIADGADEIARGNLDYEIDYNSKNELGQTVESFNQMRRRLKHYIDKQNKAEEERKELIAGIAHDVRTPLTSAKGYAQGLRDGIATTPEKQKKYLNRICTSIDDTEKILNDLLNISRYELKSYRLNKVNVNLKEFINDGASEIKTMLERSNFDFSLQMNVNPNTQISVDTDAFARVFRNIIMNSIKYARDNVHGNVRLVVSEYERTVIIELTDNGTGVEKENVSKIFDTMYRTDPARTKVSQGSGLGLAVCKQIVELHGGLIWASSKQGEGLSIFISMPKIEERKDNILLRRIDMQNVLVCDDDEAILESLRIYLDNAGFNVITAVDGRDALEKVQNNDIHCVVLDIMMPRLDGLKATLKIREKYNFPIILLSAKSEDTDKITGLGFGADDYVTKPFNPLELVARVKSQIRRYVNLGSMVATPTRLVTGGLVLDTDAKCLFVDGESVKVTPIEYKIMEYLMSNMGKVLSSSRYR